MEINEPELISRVQLEVDKINNTFSKNKTTVEKIIVKQLNTYLANKDRRIEEKFTFHNFTRKNKRYIYHRDQQECFYCKRYLSLKQSTLDHKLPIMRGGFTTMNNIILSCLWCNLDKSCLTDEEYFFKQLVNHSKGIKPLLLKVN